MKCSFWGCWPKKQDEVTTPTDIRSFVSEDISTAEYGMKIYNLDGSIKWADPEIRDLLYSRGQKGLTLEHYEFLYDCSKMRTIARRSNSNAFSGQKDPQIRKLAKELYLKHIDDSPARTPYTVEVNGLSETVSYAVNISGSMKNQLTLLNEKIDTTPRNIIKDYKVIMELHKEIMDLYEQAAKEVVDMLQLPPCPFKPNKSIFSFGGGSLRIFPPASSSKRGKGPGDGKEKVGTDWDGPQSNFNQID